VEPKPLACLCHMDGMATTSEMNPCVCVHESAAANEVQICQTIHPSPFLGQSDVVILIAYRPAKPSLSAVGCAWAATGF
jgi:hypothetical protein